MRNSIFKKKIKNTFYEMECEVDLILQHIFPISVKSKIDCFNRKLIDFYTFIYVTKANGANFQRKLKV